jgi:transposase
VAGLPPAFAQRLAPEPGDHPDEIHGGRHEEVLVEVAHVASKTRQTYLAAQYRRIATRRGKKRALMAAGHTILSLVYTLLTRKHPYRDLGATYVDTLDQHRVERRLVQRPERLGYQVSLQPHVA